MSAEPAARFVIYTDGGASPNPGPGGWAAIILDQAGSTEEISGGAPSTTNNRMELMAAISALAYLGAPSAVELYTDSQYLRQGITSWLGRWRAQGWRRRDGGPVKNVDLWRRLEGLDRRHRVSWHWVKGHAGNEWNERVDTLASAEIAARGGGAAAEPGSDEAVPPDSVRIFLKVRCVGSHGAWVADVVTPAGTVEQTGEAEDTTPNRLELECVLELLGDLPPGQAAAVYTGNDYLRRGAALWIHAWKRNRWRTKSGGPVKNAELWHRLDRQLEERRVQWPGPTGEAGERLKELKERVRELF
ncbi:MAG: ribonuclease HI [Holophagales bacterium]|nr:ribonuclease HI [Holophagales bacterium]MYI33002.1 ribonuclease HI [Holophagales bacterium]